MLLLLACVSGCQQEMANQPRVETYERAAFFPDGAGSRMQVAGTVARGQNWQPTPESVGREAGRETGEYIRNPQAMTAQLLKRGRELYDINCQHCHGRAGYGDGMVVQRGFPRPPSYHIDRLREVADGRMFEVITHGFGRMPPLGNLIPAEDRWPIVVYLRALQLSQNVPESDLSDDERATLQSVSGAGTPGSADTSQSTETAVEEGNH